MVFQRCVPAEQSQLKHVSLDFVILSVRKDTYVRYEQMYETMVKALECDTTEEKYQQHKVGECGGEIHNLQTRKQYIYINMYSTIYGYPKTA